MDATLAAERKRGLDLLIRVQMMVISVPGLGLGPLKRGDTPQIFRGFSHCHTITNHRDKPLPSCPTDYSYLIVSSPVFYFMIFFISITFAFVFSFVLTMSVDNSR